MTQTAIGRLQDWTNQDDTTTNSTGIDGLRADIGTSRGTGADHSLA